MNLSSTPERLGFWRQMVGGLFVSMGIFCALVFVLGVLAYRADSASIEQKEQAALTDGTIQIPGHWNIDDRRGIDTFTDCLVLQSSRLAPHNFLQALFTTQVYSIFYGGVLHHPCDTLQRSYTEGAGFDVEASDYSRYWWGALSLVRIFLGNGPFSLEQYREVVFVSSVVSLIVFVLSFGFSYPYVSFYFAPFLFCLAFGFSLFSLGQSLSQAPEEIVLLLWLSFFSLFRVERRSLLVKAILYGLLGSVSIYFDLMNGVAILVAIVICLQWTASALSAYKISSPSTAKENLGIKGLFLNLVFLAVGAIYALFLRFLGAAIVSGKGLFKEALEWKAELVNVVSHDTTFVERSMPSSYYDAFLALKNCRDYPFHGFFSTTEVDFIYLLGILSWVLLIPLCWRLFRKRQLPIQIVSGFLLAGSFTPLWYLVFKRHTIVHAWMTARLMPLFVGVGLAAFLVVLSLSWQGSGENLLRKRLKAKKSCAGPCCQEKNLLP